MSNEPWHHAPLREGEFDVLVMFRVTAESQDAANEAVREIVDDAQLIQGNRQGHIVPMYVPDQMFTVLAAYSPDVSCTGSEYQPYATSVLASSPEEAIALAIEGCREDNLGPDYDLDENECWREPLVSIQVLKGDAEVVA